MAWLTISGDCAFLLLNLWLSITNRQVLGAYAAVMARQLLAQSVNEARRRANLTRYVPEQIAGRLADGGVDALRYGRRQEVTMLFIDVRNFTGQSL